MLTATAYDTHMAVFIQVFERDPVRARLTADVDAAREAGLVFRHVGGVDMLVDAAQPRARSAVHLVFLNDKVPASPPNQTSEGILLAPLADLVRMKPTSYRLKDRVHIQDLDGVGLITPEIEAQLRELLRERLAETRASE